MLNKLRKIGKTLVTAVSWTIAAMIGGIVASIATVTGILAIGALQVIETPLRLWNRFTGQYKKRTVGGALSQLLLTFVMLVVSATFFTATSPVVLVLLALYWIGCIEFIYDAFKGFAESPAEEAVTETAAAADEATVNPETTNSENHAAFVAEVQAHTDGAKQDDPLNPADIKHVINELDKASEDLNTGASAPDNNQQPKPAKDNVTQLDFGNTGGASLA